MENNSNSMRTGQKSMRQAQKRKCPLVIRIHVLPYSKELIMYYSLSEKNEVPKERLKPITPRISNIFWPMETETLWRFPIITEEIKIFTLSEAKDAKN
jgi:hypothetical protein